MPYTHGGKFTFGTDEGFDATHEAMLSYLTEPTPVTGRPRTMFHMSLNLGDMTGYLNVLEVAILASHTDGDARDWAMQQYRNIASIVGVELV